MHESTRGRGFRARKIRKLVAVESRSELDIGPSGLTSDATAGLLKLPLQFPHSTMSIRTQAGRQDPCQAYGVTGASSLTPLRGLSWRFHSLPPLIRTLPSQYVGVTSELPMTFMTKFMKGSPLVTHNDMTRKDRELGQKSLCIPVKVWKTSP
jgi:hypothetical protein